MPILNYGQLRAKFKKTLKRRDCTDADADNFIDQGLSRVVRAIRTPSMERILTLTPTANGEVSIPADFVEMKHLVYGLGTTNEVKLVKKEFGEFLAMPKTAGTPAIYTRTGVQWLLRPNPGAVAGIITVIYYADPTNFTADANTDPLIDLASDAIIFAALTFAAVDYDDDRHDLFEARFQTAIGEVDLSISRSEAYEGYTAVSPATDTPY